MLAHATDMLARANDMLAHATDVLARVSDVLATYTTNIANKSTLTIIARSSYVLYLLPEYTLLSTYPVN